MNNKLEAMQELLEVMDKLRGREAVPGIVSRRIKP